VVLIEGRQVVTVAAAEGGVLLEQALLQIEAEGLASSLAKPPGRLALLGNWLTWPLA
jgi:hypothetical protein